MAKPRTVLITGASRGIGAAICRNLLSQGHEVIGLARHFDDTGNDDFHAERVDLADLKNFPERLTQLVKTYPQVDALILNAGRGQFGSVEEFSYPQIADLINLNFTANAFVSRAFLPGMKRLGRGDLIFIGSEAALWGGRRGAVYSASKAALRGFAQALREECARSGVRVCVINPGMVRSTFFDDVSFTPGDAPENALAPEEIAAVVNQVLSARGAMVYDEINLSPLKRVLRFKK